MDYMAFVKNHMDRDADITVGALPVGYDRASDFGLMKIDKEGRWARERVFFISVNPK